MLARGYISLEQSYDDNAGRNDGGNRDEVILKKYATLYKGDTIVLLTELLVTMKLGYIKHTSTGKVDDAGAGYILVF